MRNDARIFFAVFYADVFDYPLTMQELLSWIPKGEEEKNIPFCIKKLIGEKKLVYKKGYVVLPGRESLVSIRTRRKMESEKKLARAKRFSHILSFLPSVLLVGVSGSVAIENAEKNDDIDMFIITEKHTLWMTRFLVTILADMYGVRRHPGTRKVEDALCFNMFMREDACFLKQRNSFFAHEVLQMIPLLSRNRMYERFLSENAWIANVFPVSFWNLWKKRNRGLEEMKLSWFYRLSIWFLAIFEKPSMMVQLRYMQKRRTSELVNSEGIQFHPHDARAYVRINMMKRFDQYRIPPLDKQSMSF